MGKYSRNRGIRGELSLVHFLFDNYGYLVRRGDCFRHEPDIVGLDGLHVEVKNVEKVDIGSWYWQSWEAAKKYDDGIPVVFHKENRKPWLATVASKDFEAIGGGLPLMDRRQRFNVRTEIEKLGCIRYERQGVDLVTMPIEAFLDEYGEWIYRKEGANGTSAERDT